MSTRREDPNYPNVDPSPLVEAVLAILEEGNVDQATNDAIALVVEAAESQVAGQRPVCDTRLAAALQSLRPGAGLARDALAAIRYLCSSRPETGGLKVDTNIEHRLEKAANGR